MKLATKLTPEEQDTVLYWPKNAKIPITGNVISRDKKVYETERKIEYFRTINYEAELAAGVYDNGIALVLGKTLEFPDVYSFALDFDGWEAVEAWFGSWDQVLKSAARTRIEWHGQNKSSLHYIFLCKGRPIKNKVIKISDTAQIEIKCEGLLLFASPSVMPDKSPWTPIGTHDIAVLNEDKLLALEAQIDALSNEGYISDENKQRYIQWLEQPSTKFVGEGSGRHNALVILGTSYFYRYSGEWKDLTDEDRRDKLWLWNQEHCDPAKPEKEFNDIWKWIVDHHRRNRDQQFEEHRKKSSNDPLNMGAGYISYPISPKPEIYIIGTADYKIAEVVKKKTEDKTVDNTTVIKVEWTTKRTFTACKPIRIIKHKNPLSFLEPLDRFTVEFKGSEPSGCFTLKHKTISEIASELKNGNALCDNGLDTAINAQIKGFERAGQLQINDDINYIGFFTNESCNQIISSNIDITSLVDINKLKDALEYINQLAKVGFEDNNRLDLLAHTIKFGIISPCSFIFKVIKAPILEWMDLYGKPNASKSTSGKIILAIDGHHKDDDYNVNMSHVDTIARLGDTISRTTFAILVDEMDFTDNKYLINQVKSAIDQPRLRKVLDSSRRAEYIPALSPLIMTSNPDFTKKKEN